MAEQGEHYPPLPTKPPNKAQHEKACQRLQNLITEREEERRRLSAEVNTPCYSGLDSREISTECRFRLEKRESWLQL